MIKLPVRNYEESILKFLQIYEESSFKTVHLEGSSRNNTTIYLRQISEFQITETDDLTVVTNITDDKVIAEREALIIDKISHQH